MICGVDEAGRGPLAGPVVAASVILIRDIPGLNDSKLLTPAKRIRLFPLIASNAIWAYALASASEIDRINILRATHLAMVRSVLALSVSPSKVLVDGRDEIDVPYPCTSIIKGDQKEKSIMAASIIAKTVRDKIMQMIAIKYPLYGFDQHYGYPTKMHRERIGEYGRCIHHRLSFGK